MSVYRTPAGARAVELRYRELLAQWPVPSEQLMVPTRAGGTFVVASGSPGAPPVVALQGSGANAAMWSRQIGELSQYLRVYAVDVIGEPGLSAPSRPPLSSGAYADWLDDVLDGLGLDEAAIAGVSLGGWLGLDYAIRRPGRVSRLALLNPSGVGRVKYGVLLAALVLSPLGSWGRRRTLRLVLGPAVRGVAPGDPLAGFSALIFRHFRPRREPIPVFGDDALAGLRMPVLAILGERDALLDAPATARRLTAAVPGADVRLLPGAGHYLPHQAPALAGFLTGSPTGLPSAEEATHPHHPEAW